MNSRPSSPRVQRNKAIFMPTGLLGGRPDFQFQGAEEMPGSLSFDLRPGHEIYSAKEPGRWQQLPETSSEGASTAEIPYPDPPQADIPVPPQPDLPTPVPDTEPEPDKEPDLLPPETSEPPGMIPRRWVSDATS